MNDHQFLVIIPAPCGVPQEHVEHFLKAALERLRTHSYSDMAMNTSQEQIDWSLVTFQHLKAESHD